MASYAQDVKNELAHSFDDNIDCLRAEFVAMIKVGAKKIDGRIEFTNANAAVARRVIKLAKKFFPNVKPEVAAIRKKRLLKNLTYVVRFIMAGEVQNFFDTLDYAELLKRMRFRVSYLRGAFLAGGSVNRPETQYLLQIITLTASEAEFIRKQMTKLDFNAGFRRYKKKFILWLREGDTICDFLGMLGANNAVERFEIARNIKEIRMQVNRVVNMETGALGKAVDAAQKQIADIKILLDNNAPVKEHFRETMNARLENPSCTIGELAESLMYRFRMIRRLAEKFGKK